MTTAQDLPAPSASATGASNTIAALPAVPLHREAPGLAAVPDIRTTPGPVSLDEALGRAAPRLRRYATRRLGDAHEAEEIVQEALLRACQHEAGFATEDDLMAWATVVTGRLVIDRLRVRTRSVSVAEVPEHTRFVRDTADVVVARDEARAALDALEAMPTRQAGVLWAREVEGLSYDEIAQRFALTEPTVRSLLHRARRTLRREYAARGGTLPVAGIVVLIAPWHGGLHGLARLRNAAKSLAPVSASAAMVTIVGAAAVFVAPSGPHHMRPAPIVSISPSSTANQARPSASAAAQPRATTHETSTGSANDRGPSGRGPTSTNPVHRIVPMVPSACTKTAETRATTGTAGVNCRYDASTPALRIGHPLPDNPTGLRQVGVTSDKVDCRRVPTTAVTRCTTQQSDAPINPPPSTPGRP